MYLKDTIIDIAHSFLRDFARDDCMPAGHNGPYHHPETPVRNTAHWITTFCYCYKWTGEKSYKDKVEKLAKYLLNREARPYGYSFHHRNTPHKNKCNGLIGQAWTIEGLVQAAETLEDMKFSELAEMLFFQHPFNYKYGLWNRLEIDGTVLTIDPTFNHQLWFAAAGSIIESNKEKAIKERIERFLF